MDRTSLEDQTPDTAVVRRGALWWGLVVVAALLPLIMSVGLITLNINAAFDDFTPRHSDEIVYWHQIATFRAVGLNGGYYGIDELTPSAPFARFDTHGLAHPLIFGMVARVIGWTHTTPLILNIALITIGMVAFIATTKPNMRQLALLIVLVASFWQIWLYIPSVMQENFHQAGALLVAAYFSVRLQRGAATPRSFDIACAALLALLALVRLTWALFYIPYLLLLTQRWTVALIGGGALIGAAAAIFFYTGAPYPNNFVSFFVRQVSENPTPGHVTYILGAFLLENTARIGQGSPLTVIARVQIMGLLTWLLLVLYLRNGRLFPRWRGRARAALMPAEGWLHVFNLGAILYLHVQIYVIDGWIDYRVMAPHLLFSLLLLVAFQRYRAVLVVIALNVAFAGVFWSGFNALNAWKFRGDVEQRAAFSRALDHVLVYDPAADSAWCNTILTQGYPPELTELPAGIGFTVNVNDSVRSPMQSRYVLADAMFDDALTPLAETPIGTLYRNDAVAC